MSVTRILIKLWVFAFQGFCDIILPLEIRHFGKILWSSIGKANILRVSSPSTLRTFVITRKSRKLVLFTDRQGIEAINKFINMGTQGKCYFYPTPCQLSITPCTVQWELFHAGRVDKIPNAEPIRRQQVDFSGVPTALLASSFAAILPFSRFVGWGK